MRKPPIRLTEEATALLMREAQLRAAKMTIKQIAREIGASRTFVQEHLARLANEIRERQKVVPRGTRKVDDPEQFRSST